MCGRAREEVPYRLDMDLLTDEALLKAVLLKHEVAVIKKRSVTRNHHILHTNASNDEAARDVYQWPEHFVADAGKWTWLARQLRKKRIRFSFDINSGTLNSCKGRLSELRKKGVISHDEFSCLFNALTVFADVRRNTDAHTFFGWTVGGAINGDLEQVLLPMVNALFDVYNRGSTIAGSHERH